jgi:hypothetical protein
MTGRDYGIFAASAMRNPLDLPYKIRTPETRIPKEIRNPSHWANADFTTGPLLGVDKSNLYL